MDIQPTLTGVRFRIRPLHERDREGLYLAARDPLIWEQNPASSRFERGVFDDYFTALRNAGGALVFEDIANDKIIGCSRYYQAPNAPPDWSIGFTFIERSLWGGHANLELKSLILDHLFSTEEQVWFHIGRGNIRSQKATMKLGAIKTGTCSADLLGTGTSSFYFNFVLTNKVWSEAKASAPNV
jgi:RimJ/RimL family protein N-acetyltransferase